MVIGSWMFFSGVVYVASSTLFSLPYTTTRNMGPARTLGRRETPPCVFARVVSRSVLRTRGAAPGNPCPRVRTAPGQCAHTPTNPPCFHPARCGVLEHTSALTAAALLPRAWATNSRFQATHMGWHFFSSLPCDLGSSRGVGLSPTTPRSCCKYINNSNWIRLSSLRN